jgi:hypothetical protein
MAIGKQDFMGGPYIMSVEDFQNLKMIEDRASDTLLCLDSTLDTIVTLAEMHCQYFGGTSATGCVSDTPTKSHSYAQLDVALVQFANMFRGVAPLSWVSSSLILLLGKNVCRK